MKEVFECDNKSIIFMGDSFENFNEEEVIMGVFQKLGWTAKITFEKGNSYKEILLAYGDDKYYFKVYLSKITSGNTQTEKYAKFESTSNMNENITSTQHPVIKVVLGIYGREEYREKIFCAWHTNDYFEDGQTLVFNTDIRAISGAFKRGMQKCVSAKQNVSYAFREEFLIYYLLNVSNLY